MLARTSLTARVADAVPPLVSDDEPVRRVRSSASFRLVGSANGPRFTASGASCAMRARMPLRDEDGAALYSATSARSFRLFAAPARSMIVVFAASRRRVAAGDKRARGPVGNA